MFIIVLNKQSSIRQIIIISILFSVKRNGVELKWSVEHEPQPDDHQTG